MILLMEKLEPMSVDEGEKEILGPWHLRPRTIDPNEPPGEALFSLQGFMDSASLAQEIGIEGADDDSGMAWPLLVKA
jgi:hypothetical protein